MIFKEKRGGIFRKALVLPGIFHLIAADRDIPPLMGGFVNDRIDAVLLV